MLKYINWVFASRCAENIFYRPRHGQVGQFYLLERSFSSLHFVLLIWFLSAFYLLAIPGQLLQHLASHLHVAHTPRWRLLDFYLGSFIFFFYPAFAKLSMCKLVGKLRPHCVYIRIFIYVIFQANRKTKAKAFHTFNPAPLLKLWKGKKSTNYALQP